MTISENKVVSFSYELREGGAKGEVVQTVDKEQAFAIIFGMGMLLPAFEDNIRGLSAGDPFEFGIPSAEAYGTYKAEMVADVPRSVFVMEDGKPANDILQVGNFVPMKDQHGRPVQGQIIEITDESVKMDFNHPMADKDLHFKGEIVDVRDATPEELDHGHVHGPGGHHH